MGAAIIPNLDSIAEFRILTSNFDAEYGNYAGGRINVVTKSGTNQFHGSAFEFLRNTDLDSRNFFSPERAVYQQNQVGGLFGGPIIKDKVFFYSDYQATQLKQGVDTGLIQVPSLPNRGGNFSDAADELTGTVSGQYWANQLAGKLGCWRYCRRALLYRWLHRYRPMRLSQRRHPPARLVRARAKIIAIYSHAEPAQQLLFDIGRRPNAQRR